MQAKERPFGAGEFVQARQFFGERRRFERPGGGLVELSHLPSEGEGHGHVRVRPGARCLHCREHRGEDGFSRLLHTFASSARALGLVRLRVRARASLCLRASHGGRPSREGATHARRYLVYEIAQNTYGTPPTLDAEEPRGSSRQDGSLSTYWNDAPPGRLANCVDIVSDPRRADRACSGGVADAILGFRMVPGPAACPSEEDGFPQASIIRSHG